MVAVLLVGGIGLLLGGLLTIGFGIPVKEFSFGNTLILTGAIVSCTGIIMLALWIVMLEVKNITQRFGLGLSPRSRAGNAPGPRATPGDRTSEDGDFLFGRDQPMPDHAARAGQAVPTPPWQEETASRDRGAASSEDIVEGSPAAKPRRNLLFSSTSRKERDRAQGRMADPDAVDLGRADPGPVAPVAPPPAELAEPPPATFDDAWPKSERTRAADAPSPRRGGPAPSTFAEAGVGASGADRHPPAARNEDRPPVTVLKSGVVDGMAYSLYSDGSIEAQMPEGMMRFASIDELRSHLDQRS
jgi:hypothetical protein